MRYRKLPVEVEVYQLTFRPPEMLGETPELTNPPAWLKVALDSGIVSAQASVNKRWLVIHTLEGPMIGQEHDWIIKGVKGEIYACKPDVFELTYERIE